MAKTKSKKATKRKTKTKAQVKKTRAKFESKVNAQKSLVKKQQQAMNDFMIQREELMRKANIIQALYKSKPEIGKVVDDKMAVNEDLIEVKNNILCWKEESNPVFSGLDDFTNLPSYSMDFVSTVLNNIYAHDQKIQVEMDDLDDFEIVEDEDIEI